MNNSYSAASSMVPSLLVASLGAHTFSPPLLMPGLMDAARSVDFTGHLYVLWVPGKAKIPELCHDRQYVWTEVDRSPVPDLAPPRGAAHRGRPTPMQAFEPRGGPRFCHRK